MNRSRVAALLAASVTLAAIGMPSNAGTKGSVSRVIVRPVPNEAGQLARYTITFVTGRGGLIAGDAIGITLPKAPSDCPSIADFAKNVTVNGRRTSVYAISSCRDLRVRVPAGISVGRNNRVAVVLGSSKRVLTNPGPGAHALKVRTSRDAGVASRRFRIMEGSASTPGVATASAPGVSTKPAPPSLTEPAPGAAAEPGSGGATTSGILAPAVITINLCAAEGTADVGPASVPIWGFGLSVGPLCTAELPGPVLGVDTLPIFTGNTVVINFDNQVPGQDVRLEFVGQSPPPTRMTLPGGVVTYTFTAAAPGTFIYQAADNRQVLMGLYGALVVLPVALGQAYNTAASAFDAQAVVVLSEIDPAFNNDPLDFDLLGRSPTYWLVNGKAYESGDPALISAAPNSRVLLRFVNAGGGHHTMSLLGAHQRIIARDAYPVAHPLDVVAETIPTGSTMDAIARIPAAAGAGTRFWLYNGQLHLDNAGAFPGGMLTFLQAGP